MPIWLVLGFGEPTFLRRYSEAPTYPELTYAVLMLRLPIEY